MNEEDYTRLTADETMRRALDAGLESIDMKQKTMAVVVGLAVGAIIGGIVGVVVAKVG